MQFEMVLKSRPANRANVCIKVVALAAIVFAPAAHADQIAMDFSGSNTNALIANSVLGYTFTTTKVLDVTELGIWDATGGGLGSAHEVGIWNNSGTLLVSGSVGAGTVPKTAPSVSGGVFRLADVSQILNPGTYEIAAFYSGFGDVWAEGATSLPIAGVSYGAPVSTLSGSFTRPTSNSFGITGSYYGPTFAVSTATPEPGSIALMSGMLAVSGCLAARRRKRA